MDEEDLDDNINQIADEVDLSPKKISQFRTNHGKQKKKNRKPTKSTIQKKSHISKSISR